MKELLEWLEEGGQDYARGLALYEAHGRSSVVLTTLRYGATDFTRRKLREELTRLAQGTPAAPPPPVRPAPSAAAPAPDVRAQRSSWFAERHRLHAQLELVATDEERRVMAERIVQLSDFLTQSYHPALPAAEAARSLPELASLTDVGEIRRRLGNLRALASKLKKNPARALDLQQVRADIDLLESKLPQKP